MYTIATAHDGMFETILLKSDTCTATVTPARGGMLTGLTYNGKEYLFCNPDNFNDKAIPPERPRCACPVLFPSLGLCEHDTFLHDGKAYPMAIHGLVQHQAWQVVASGTDNGAWVTLRVTADATTKQSYPFDYAVEITYRLQDNTVALEQTYTNLGQGNMPFGFGFHPYFTVRDMRQVVPFVQAQQMTHVPGAVCTAPMPQTLELPYDADGISYTLCSGAAGEAGFTDPQTNQKVTVSFDENFTHVIFWCICANGFLCVEPWNTLPNTINTAPANLLATGQSKTARIAITVA